MPGLISQAPQQQAQPQSQGEDPNVNRILIAAKKVLAMPQIAQQIVQIMKASPDPATGIAQAMVFLMKALYEKSKGTMPQSAIPMAAAGILADVARLGEAAGLFQLSPQLLMDAGKKSMAMLRGQQAQAPAQPAAQPPMQPPPAQPPAAAPVQAGA